MKKFFLAAMLLLIVASAVFAQAGTTPAAGTAGTAAPAAAPAVSLTQVQAAIAGLALLAVGWVIRHFGFLAPPAATGSVGATAQTPTGKPVVAAIKTAVTALVNELEDDDPQLGNILKLFAPSGLNLAETQAQVANLQALAPVVSQLASSLAPPTTAAPVKAAS